MARIKNKLILEKFKLTGRYYVLLQRNLRWAGNINRLEEKEKNHPDIFIGKEKLVVELVEQTIITNVILFKI